jgi:Uma2 family endonuclease
MVAQSAITSYHPNLTPTEIVRRLGIGPVRFSIHDAIQMVQRGIIPEDATVELLDGELIYRDRFDLRGDEIVEGIKHNYVVSALGALQGRINSDTRHLRTQSTLVCAEKHAPIPDAMVLRGGLDAYRERLPAAADAWSVVEVADASYERDVGDKLRGYARAGIEQYIIINLRNRTAEIYGEPDPQAGTYPAPTVIAADGALPVRVGGNEFFSVPMGQILP